ncbi:hypothetical protein ACHAXA_002480 [Cyclostephanos tholiformis]|uniref:Uncharacterized protein n=1 Tax=Cyclostephanos tholiformis TaxID=382380 RepID=A0ABD3RZV7_9STRA
MTEAMEKNGSDAAGASFDDVVHSSIDDEAVHSTEGAATADKESRGVATSDVDVDNSKSNESHVDVEDKYDEPVHGEKEKAPPAPRDMADSVTVLDEGESTEKLIILPNFAGDPIILPVKSKQKTKQKNTEPIQNSFVVGDVLDKELMQKVSEKHVAEIASNEELVRDAALVEELSHTGESYTTSSSQSHHVKSDHVDVGDPLDLKEDTPIVTNSTESKDKGDGEDGPRQIKLVDYASKLAGAQILEQSPSLKGSSNLLTGDKDKYSIAPCMDKKYIVIGLSEDILVKQIILSNYERYSSRVKEFQVLASQEYPTPSEDYWNSIGTYEAHSKSGEQAFELLEPTWARYLKIRFLSHYGNEHYCTLSQIKVHGSTMLQGFHEQWIESEKKDWESELEDGATVEGGGESEAKLSGEDGNMEIEGDTEVVEEKVNENVIGDSEIIAVDDSSIEVTQNNREADATEDASIVTVNYEVQSEFVSRTTVEGEQKGRKDSNRLHQETMASSMKEIGVEESSFVGQAPQGCDELLSEIDLDVKHSVEAAAAGHRGVEGEETQVQIAESNANNDILEDDYISISDNIERHKVASNVLDPINLEREYIPANGFINSSIDEVKSLIDASDVKKLDSLRITVPSVIAPIELGDRDEEGKVVKHPSDTKMEKKALAETPMKQMDDVNHSQATDETAKDYSKLKGEETSALIDIAKNGTKPEKGISNPKVDSRAEADSGPIVHEVLTDSEKDGKERSGIEKSTGELYAKLSRRFPHASCIQDLEFQAFKSKTLSVHAGSAGSVGGGAKMEPIFTKITSEIKSVQITQHQYEQFISALKTCYDAMFLDVVKDLDSIQENFNQRLSSLERDDFVSVMRTNGHLSPSSFGRSSVFPSTFTAMMHQIASATKIQERSNIFCAASLAICLLLLRRITQRNKVSGPGDKTIRNNGFKAIGKSTSAQLVGRMSYNSNPKKNDRNRRTRHICQIQEITAENNLPPELIAANDVVRELIAENNLLKKEAAQWVNFQGTDPASLPDPSESLHITSPLTTSSLRPPFRLSHIEHVVIRCRNFPVMFDFYHRILGCSIDEPLDDHVGRFGGALTHLRAGSCYIDLLCYDTRRLTDGGCDAVARMHAGGAGLDGGEKIVDVNFSPVASTLDHLCLRIDPFDRHRLLDYFENMNVDIVRRTTAGDTRLGADGVGPYLYLRDPEGNVIELKGRPIGDKAKSSLDEKAGKPSGEKTTAAAELLAERRRAALAQRRAYEHYRRRDGIEPTGGGGGPSSGSSTDERNARLAWYAAATVIGALGATYAAVPLYKVFCQTTGFGGTTQRVSLSDWAERREARESSSSGGGGGPGPGISRALWEKLIAASNVPREMLPGGSSGIGHGGGAAAASRGGRTWTDEEAAAKLASLRPRKDGRLITVRFDSTVGDVLPWTFVPAQLDVKVVPGETALSFFTATNKSDKAITGVATYNVHPPKVGLYFNKIQCFCFEEQRLLPGETVDMPGHLCGRGAVKHGCGEELRLTLFSGRKFSV